jgi:MFS family permease
MTDSRPDSSALNGISLRLYLTTFITGVCGNMIIIFISAYVYDTTGDPALSAAILAASFAPQAFATRIIGSAIDKYGSVAALIFLSAINWCVGVAALELVRSAGSVFVILPLILVRALCAASERANTVKLLRSAVGLAAIRNALSIMNFVYFAATAIAGLGLIVISLKSVTFLIGVVTVLYVGVIAVALPIAAYRGRLDQERKTEVDIVVAVSAETVREREKLIQSLGLYIWLVRVSEAFYQGAYSALVTYIPLHIFATSHVSVGAYQVAASLGIVLGFGFAQLLLRASRNAKQIVFIVGVCGAFASIGWIASVNDGFPLWGSLMAFCVLNIGYETIWLFATVRIDADAPFDQVAEISFRTGAWAALWMAVLAVSYGFILKSDISNQFSAVALAGAGWLALISGATVIRRNIERSA